MLGQGKIARCLVAFVLLAPAFAQTQHPQSPPADGQWHRFSDGGSNAGRPNDARPDERRAQNQPGHAGNWLRRYKDLPPAQQRRALDNDPQFRKLPPQQQERLLQRLQHFSSLPPAQQERILNRMETWEHLTPDQKKRASQLFQDFKQLPPPRRQAVNRAIRDMRGLTPDQRDRLINSEPFRQLFSPFERHILMGAAHLPLAPGDVW